MIYLIILILENARHVFFFDIQGQPVETMVHIHDMTGANMSLR